MEKGERIIHRFAVAAAFIVVLALARAVFPREAPAGERGANTETAVDDAGWQQAYEADGTPMTSPEFVPPVELMSRHLQGWQRPEGPIKVAIQAGHWQSKDAPDEQDNLRFNGATAAGKDEWEITLAIAERTVALLRAAGVEAELLPTVVPTTYYADAFVTIHADESPRRGDSGYRTAASWLDLSGKSGALAEAVDAAYGEATGMRHGGNVTDNMRRYYAFNWLVFEHALHPMVPAAIIETGFMTNADDRKTIFNRPDAAAKGVAEGVLRFLNIE